MARNICNKEALANLVIISSTQMKVGSQCMLVITNVSATDLSQRAMEPHALTLQFVGQNFTKISRFHILSIITLLGIHVFTMLIPISVYM